MARTCKWEHLTDGWHLGHRLERKARPAGRLDRELEAELAELLEDDEEVLTW